MEVAYNSRVVSRAAPRWAWDVIDDVLEACIASGGDDSKLADAAYDASQAMAQACEEEVESLPREDVKHIGG